MRTLYRGRFAPSPTGALHLGLARTALLGWLRARSCGGAFVLRVEDIDRARVVPGSAAQMLRDLSFLGLTWDEGPDVGGPCGPYLQTARYSLYEDALKQLRARGLLYPCSCSRKDIAVASAPHGAAEFGPRYPGTCRFGPTRPEAALTLRFRAPDALPPLHDPLLGDVPQGAQGDFVVRRADGTVSYQLAVVVDDIAMGVTEVLRGADLAGCTGWQIALYDALGARVPGFVHVPLLLGSDGKRLAKRDGAEAVSALVARGVPADAIVGALAASAGLVPEGTRCSAAALIDGFALERIRETRIDWSRALRASP